MSKFSSDLCHRKHMPNHHLKNVSFCFVENQGLHLKVANALCLYSVPALPSIYHCLQSCKKTQKRKPRPDQQDCTKQLKVIASCSFKDKSRSFSFLITHDVLLSGTTFDIFFPNPAKIRSLLISLALKACQIQSQVELLPKEPLVNYL